MAKVAANYTTFATDITVYHQLSYDVISSLLRGILFARIKRVTQRPPAKANLLMAKRQAQPPERTPPRSPVGLLLVAGLARVVRVMARALAVGPMVRPGRVVKVMVMHAPPHLSPWLIPLLAMSVLNQVVVLLSAVRRRGGSDALATE
jgi:hypothetical protein